MTSKTSNVTVNKWLQEMKDLLCPDNVVWVDGSDEQREALREEAVKLGELTRLNQESSPDATCTAPILTTLLVLRTEPLSAPRKRKPQAPPITGVILSRCTRSSTASQRIATRAAQCISFLIQWAPSARLLQR